MDKLRQAKKITKATFKNFVKRNASELYVKEKSRFDGMTDGIEQLNTGFNLTGVDEERLKGDYAVIDGVWLVGGGRDYFTIWEDDTHYGIEVYNCCGSSIVAVKK